MAVDHTTRALAGIALLVFGAIVVGELFLGGGQLLPLGVVAVVLLAAGAILFGTSRSGV